MQFRRGDFLGAAASAAAYAIVRAPARAADLQFKLGHTQTVEHPQHVRLVQMSKQIAQETNGRLAIQVFPNSQLGGQEAMLSQLRLGAIQMLVTGDATFGSVVPAAYVDSVAFAFKDSKAAWAVMGGAVGDYIRKELDAKGIHVMKGSFIEQGMREVTSSTKPIRNVDDFAGFKIRVAPGNIYVDLFRTLGAAPVVLDQAAVYPGLQTHIVDGQETPYLVIETQRVYEVQRYLSVTNHMWTGNTFAINGDVWKALPADIQGSLERNGAKYAALERTDAARLNAALADKLRRQGLIFNVADTASMRARLGPYYAHWRNEMGNTLWALFEESVGKLA